MKSVAATIELVSEWWSRPSRVTHSNCTGGFALGVY